MDWIVGKHLECNANGHLEIGGVDALKLAAEYKTPVLVLNEQRLRVRFRELQKSLKKGYNNVQVCYAVKANPCLAVLKILLNEGAGLEVVSECELLTALKAGAKSESIVFNGPNKSEKELELAVKNQVKINVDSFSELRRLEVICKSLNKTADVFIRLNPAITPKTNENLTTGAEINQFGVYLNDAERVFELASKIPQINLKGIHMHIGSQITSLEPFKEMVNKAFKIVVKLREQGIFLTYLNFGGGLGVQYEGVTKLPTAGEYGTAVTATIKSNMEKHGLKDLHLLFEPGRYISADAGVYLLKIGTIKTPPAGRKWVLVDGGSNILLRAALGIYKFRMILANKANLEPNELVNVGGPLCFGGDVIGRSVNLPSPEEGDVLAVFCSGAYTDSISHQYNMRPRPAMVLVNEGKHYLIKRAEQCEDLVARDIIPDHLKDIGK
jgi:diaminopimelate decarboxylase